MFGIFGNRRVECPVEGNMKDYLESAFQWFIDVFGHDYIRNKPVLLADDQTFPINYNGSFECAFDTVKIVARQMDIDPEEIMLLFYKDGMKVLNSSDGHTSAIFIGHEAGADMSSGLYHGKHDDGKYHISIETSNLFDPMGLVATLAHEMSHIKLLGEGRIEENDELLTDLTTIIYGLGIFSANTDFRFERGKGHWAYRKMGYLSQIEWGYALAVYAQVRGEAKPEWATFLSQTIKGNFDRGLQFIAENPDTFLVKC